MLREARHEARQCRLHAGETHLPLRALRFTTDVPIELRFAAARSPRAADRSLFRSPRSPRAAPPTASCDTSLVATCSVLIADSPASLALSNIRSSKSWDPTAYAAPAGLQLVLQDLAFLLGSPQRESEVLDGLLVGCELGIAFGDQRVVLFEEIAVKLEQRAIGVVLLAERGELCGVHENPRSRFLRCGELILEMEMSRCTYTQVGDFHEIGRTELAALGSLLVSKGAKRCF